MNDAFDKGNFPGGRAAGFRQLRRVGLRVLLALVICSVTASAVAGNEPGANGQATGSALGRFRHWLQIGQASWYSNKLQGRRTAAGDRYDMHSLTCAHRTLPLGSWLRVTNLRNRKSVVVRVNDRGPMTGDRIVDLSYAAAHAVGLDGVGEVKLEAVAAEDAAVASALLTKAPLPLAVR